MDMVIKRGGTLMDHETYRLFRKTLIWLAALLLFALIIAQAFPAAGQQELTGSLTTIASSQ